MYETRVFSLTARMVPIHIHLFHFFHILQSFAIPAVIIFWFKSVCLKREKSNGGACMLVGERVGRGLLQPDSCNRKKKRNKSNNQKKKKKTNTIHMLNAKWNNKHVFSRICAD